MNYNVPLPNATISQLHHSPILPGLTFLPAVAHHNDLQAHYTPTNHANQLNQLHINCYIPCQRWSKMLSYRTTAKEFLLSY